MKKICIVSFVTIILCSSSFIHSSFVQELIQAQEARGIRVANPEDIKFENQVKNLSVTLTAFPLDSLQNNQEAPSATLISFYSLFFNPEYIKFSSKGIMNDFFEQLKTWHDTLRKNNVTVAWPVTTQSQDLKKLLVQSLKEICLFGRYSKHKEENLITFKLRLQYILTNIMLDPYLALWKNELITNNQAFFLGSFYSWDVATLKSEFKDSVALTPLFTRLTATIDIVAEEQATKYHEQEVAREKELTLQRQQSEASILASLVSQIEQEQKDKNTDKTLLYSHYIWVLLNPAYLDLSTADRKHIDAFHEQFKKLHASIGKTFIPLFSPEEINGLQLLTAKSLETISSPLSGKTGGVKFKNHIESVLKTIMSINRNQTLTENQIKYQWIKPLYTDNHFLTPATKARLFNLFNNENFQRWQASTRNMTLKITSSPYLAQPTPATIEPSVIPPTPQPIIEEITENLPQPTPAILQKRPLRNPVIRKTSPMEQVRVSEGSTPITFEIIQPQPIIAAPAVNVSTKIQEIGKALISQALIAPAATITKTFNTVTPEEQLDLLNTIDEMGYTAVHSDASLARSDILAIFFKNLAPQQKFIIITQREKDGQTPLHLIAGAKSAPTKGFNPVNAAKELLKDLSLQQQVQLINMQDNNGSTAIDIAQGVNKALAINLRQILQRAGI